MNEVQQEMRGFQNATMERFSVIDQNVTRLDSNIDTQKKYFGQELKTTQMTAEAALNQGSANRDSISAILEYTGQNNQFMSGLMDRLANLRFDLPNMLDQWANTRYGENAGPSTVTASQLHHGGFQSATPNVPIPRLQLPVVHPQTTDQQQHAVVKADPATSWSQKVNAAMPSSSSPPFISRTLWQEFMQSSSSGEEADPDRGGRSRAQEGPIIKTEPADHVEGVVLWPRAAEPQSSQGGVAIDAETTMPPDEASQHREAHSDSGVPAPAIDVEGQNLDQANEPAHLRRSDGNNVSDPTPPNTNLIADDPIEPVEAHSPDDPIEQTQTVSTHFPMTEDPICSDTPEPSQTLHAEVPMVVDDDPITAEVPVATGDDHPMGDESGGDVGMDARGGDVMRDVVVRIIQMPPDTTHPVEQAQSTSEAQNEPHHQQETPISTAVAQDEPHPEQATPIPHAVMMATPSVIPPTPGSPQGSLRSSPSLVTGMTVHPPPGLLAGPSAIAASNDADDSRNLRLGPVTRSRSGSRSTSNEPAARQSSAAPSRKPKSKGRKAK